MKRPPPDRLRRTARTPAPAAPEARGLPRPRWLAVALLFPALASPAAPGPAEPATLPKPAPDAANQPAPPAATGDVNLPELSFDELINVKIATVFGASKHWQETAEAPGMVSILTAEEIKLFGHRTLGEALRSMPGLYLTYDRNYTSLGIAGFNRGDINTHVLVMIDGHRLNDSIQDAVPLGHDFDLDIDLIDRIEVIQGPGAVIHGNNAFFGVINVIPKQGRDFQGAEAAAAYGSLNSARGRFSLGRRAESGIEYLLSGSFRSSSGNRELYYPEFDAPETNDGIARKVDDEQSFNLFGSGRWKAFSFVSSLVHRDKTIPTASYGTVFNSPRNLTEDLRGFTSIRFDQSLPKDWEVNAHLSYDHTAYNGAYLYDEAPAPPPEYILNLDRFRGDRINADVQVTKVFADKHTVSAGADARYHLREEMQNYNRSPRETFLDVHQHSSAAGGYANAILTLPAHLQLHAGLRYDHYDTFGGTLNPRLALVFTPVRTTVLKVVGGTAYRAPNPYERLYSDGGFSTEPNDRLDPETIATLQTIWSQELPAQVRLETSAFYYQVDDLISQAVNPDTGLLRYDNTARVKAGGGQVRLAKNWSSGIRTAASYTFQEVRDSEADRWLTGSPRHLARASLVVPLAPDRIFAGLEVQYTGESATLAGRTSDDYWLLNLNFYAQRILPNLEVSAGFYNLLNDRYEVPGKAEHVQDVIAQDGLTFRLKLTYRF